MDAVRVYFSLSEITDPAKHRAHNEWHQLDHRPENLLLPGIVWGDRWVRSPDCAAASTVAAAGYANVHYAIMYWFREPLAETLDDFFHLSERSFQWGRSPQIGFTRRPMRGLFVPLRGWVAPRVRVSAEALPLRPVHGMIATLSRLDGHAPEAAGLLRRQDEERMPALLACPGVAGAWTFAAEDLFGPQDPGAWTFADRGVRAGTAAPTRLELIYLDGDPLAAQAAIAACGAPPVAGQVMFSSPLRAIVPWEWDWFERP